MNDDLSHLPRHAILSSDEVEVYQAATEKGIFNLTTAERWWRDRRQYLVSRGYDLRPRYHAGWVPSWKNTRRDPTFCEDYIMLEGPHVIDAVRVVDSVRVSIKCIRNNAQEVEIAKALTSAELLENPKNHCVPILDTFPDPFEPHSILMIMPLLCPFDDPPLRSVFELLDFIKQTLEGLSFIHSQGVAHRDCASANIMMDATPLYPAGHHPVRRTFSVDGTYPLSPLSRIDNPVRYYFIDFGISTRFAPGQSPLVTGARGRDKELPELSRDIPYDAFKADVFILGNLYKKEFLEKYHDLSFLSHLVAAMTHQDPNKRPTVHFALAFFQVIRGTRNAYTLRSRLRPKDETVAERVVYDAVAMARATLYHFLRVVA
ncbi:hypothetical protein EVG20_g9649 [Dentipellis fragilis]|uniref:Protein kinase domain-containing protein n=1 Tax=Dentipellis fragilis TaxID=205917 RepID=A0A4Y9XZ11_9AGAM|nr:hypothetical protein EVG20_g9649 [Dentipellis fragilis]